MGNECAAEFIDNIQKIVTNMMKTSGYSVGMSDLISNKETNEKIDELLKEHKKQGGFDRSNTFECVSEYDWSFE